MTLPVTHTGRIINIGIADLFAEELKFLNKFLLVARGFGMPGKSETTFSTLKVLFMTHHETVPHWRIGR